MSTTEEIRGNFETWATRQELTLRRCTSLGMEYFDTHADCAWCSWQAAYSQGYKDALTAVAEKAEREAPALDDGMYGGIATHALQEFAKRIGSLPIQDKKGKQ